MSLSRSRMVLLSAFLVLLSVTSLTSSARAETQIQVWARVMEYSCGYFSRRAADIAVTLNDSDLPFGTTVNLIHGYGSWRGGAGVFQYERWLERTVVPAKAIDIGVWEARIEDKTFATRSGSLRIDRLQFVFEVLVPGQAAVYVNGGSTWGFFETEIMQPSMTCVGGNHSNQQPTWRQFQWNAVAVP